MENQVGPHPRHDLVGRADTDEPRVARQHALDRDPIRLLDGHPSAIASISIRASEPTSTIVSAGYGSLNHRPRSATIFGKFAMSVRKIVTLTIRSSPEPPASRTRWRLRNTCSAWASKSPTPTTSPSSPIAAWPETKIRSSARIACEIRYGSYGSDSVRIRSTIRDSYAWAGRKWLEQSESAGLAEKTPSRPLGVFGSITAVLARFCTRFVLPHPIGTAAAGCSLGWWRQPHRPGMANS